MSQQLNGLCCSMWLNFESLSRLMSSLLISMYCVLIAYVQEKAMGNRPSEMMDREKAYIPELQISFMEHIAMPIYKCVQNWLPQDTLLYFTSSRGQFLEKFLL